MLTRLRGLVWGDYPIRFHAVSMSLFFIFLCLFGESLGPEQGSRIEKEKAFCVHL